LILLLTNSVSMFFSGSGKSHHWYAGWCFVCSAGLTLMERKDKLIEWETTQVYWNSQLSLALNNWVNPCCKISRTFGLWTFYCLMTACKCKHLETSESNLGKNYICFILYRIMRASDQTTASWWCYFFIGYLYVTAL
jgi:hypothetical protein